MLQQIAFFIALSIFTANGFGEISHPPAQPKQIIVTDLLHRLSCSEAIALFGREHLIDSSLSDATDPSLGKQGRSKDPASGRNTASKLSLKQLVFAPVTFEGFPAKVTIFFDGDSSFKATVSVPYPLKLRAGATLGDFTKLGANIAKSIGKPTVSTETYIDYITNGHQYVFGNLKDGLITIDISQGSR